MTMDELLKKLRCNQIELADMCGVSPTTVSHFIKGRAMSLKVAHAIDVLAAVESGTAYNASKAVQQARFEKAQKRLEKLGIDLSQSPVGEDEA